jgi:hypothetical protein
MKMNKKKIWLIKGTEQHHVKIKKTMTEGMSGEKKADKNQKAGWSKGTQQHNA